MNAQSGEAARTPLACRRRWYNWDGLDGELGDRPLRADHRAGTESQPCSHEGVRAPSSLGAPPDEDRAVDRRWDMSVRGPGVLTRRSAWW